MTTPATASDAASTASWTDRYLAFLGLERETPSHDALGRILRAHRIVTFENLTSILRRAAHPDGTVPAPDPEELLANWEAGRGGGVCFEMTDMLHRLLVSLGYRAYPVLAQISFPGSHQAVLVEIDGARYLGDTGNGAPFWEPIPVDRPYEVHHAGLAFRFRPGDDGETCVQDRFIDGAWQQFFVYDLRPATDDERFEAMQRHHAIGESWVVDIVRLVRCDDGGVWALRGDELVRHTDDGKSTERLATPEDYIRVARDAFALPAAPIVEALETIARRSQVGAQA